MTLRVTEDDQQALEQLAKEDGVSLQAAAIKAIHEAAARRGHAAKVAAASSRVRAKYGDVIKRLGQ
ncbi:CopG family transcriptional regulator [Glutamicibacter creatinolyticus]|uniref:CopG family transcriptional regulator n=1 Tax=Glutamicibacter creatinolyticus TaxID=162496 RepID=UPI0031E2EB49